MNWTFYPSRSPFVQQTSIIYKCRYKLLGFRYTWTSKQVSGRNGLLRPLSHESGIELERLFFSTLNPFLTIQNCLPLKNAPLLKLIVATSYRDIWGNAHYQRRRFLPGGVDKPGQLFSLSPTLGNVPNPTL